MTAVEAPPRHWIGEALPRAEDERFLRGQAQFVDDLKLPSMLHAAFVRSPFAHGRLLAVDTATALARPGVRVVLTGAMSPRRSVPAEGATWA